VRKTQKTQIVIHCCYAAIDEERYKGKGIKIVDIDEKDRTQYEERGLDQHTYNYGAEIDENAQFNHQTRGPDGVTYGCYGYLDEEGKLQSRHYIADARGFRLLTPRDEVIEVFPIATKSK
jgi:Insect cuticle protein